MRDLPGGMKAREPLSQEEQAQLSSNDEEGSVGRQAGLLCHNRARDTRKGCKTGCVCVCVDPSTGSSSTTLPHTDILSQRLHPSRHP